MNPGLSSFYTTGGTLSQDAPSYVERQADHDLLQGLRAGEFCYVLTSRQMGKSSLMVRTATKLRDGGTRVIALDLTAVGQNVTPEQWYDGLLAQMGRQLRLDDQLETTWRSKEGLGPCQRFFAAIRDAILPELSPAALVIFVDEIDTVRSLPFATDEFFAAIRECYNRRGQDPEFRRLTFGLLGVATPSDLIRDTRTTPFNIGRRIELHDFTEEEAAPLAKGMRHSDSLQMPSSVGGSKNGTKETKRLLNRVLFWTGGHPYLTQRFCRAITEETQVRGPADVDRIAEELFFTHRAKERDDNLLFVRDRLLRSETDVPSLLELYLKVRASKPVADDETSPRVSVLRLSGIVKSVRGRLVARNRIYARVFDRAWVYAHMPDVEVRRQRAAFYQGVIRTTSIAAVVVAALGIAVIVALKQLAISYFSQAQLRRASAVKGQRLESLDFLRLARRGRYIRDDALRDEAIACLALVDLKLKIVCTHFPPDATAVALSPNLDRYAVGQDSGAIVVMRTTGDQAITRLPATGLPVVWLALSPDGVFLAAQYADDRTNRFVVWNVDDSRTVIESTNRVRQGALDFSPDGAAMAAVLEPGALDVISLPDAQRLARLPLRQATNTPREPNCVRFDASGRRLAESGPGSQRAQIWNLAGQSATNRFLPSEITALAWSADDNHLAAAGPAGLRLWDLGSDRARWLAQSEAEEVLDMAFNPEGTLLASLNANRTLRLWCPATGRNVTESLPAESTARIFFTTDGRLGLAGLRTGVRIWQVEGGAEYRVFRAPTEFYAPLHSLAFDPQGRVLIGASDLGAFFWDAATGRTLPTLPMHSVRCLCVHPMRGDLLVSRPQGLYYMSRRVVAGAPGVAYHFDAPRSYDLPGGLEECSLGHEGRQAVVMHGNHVHELHVDEPNTVLLPFRSDWKALALSPDGRWLAMWSETNNHIQVMAMQNPRAADGPVKTIPAGKHFAFTPDSRFLLTGLAKRNQLWSTATWAVTASFDGLALYGEENAPVAFGRLGTAGTILFAIADETGVIRLYEMTGSSGLRTAPAFRLLARLEGPDRKRVSSLTFNPQGSRLAVATAVQTVQVWDLAGVRRGLADLGLADSLPGFLASEAAPLTITFDPMETRASDPGWSRVCNVTFDLVDAARANPADRAKHFVERGKIYLKLKRLDLARVDFEEARRLKPQDAEIPKLLDRVRREGSSQPDTP